MAGGILAGCRSCGPWPPLKPTLAGLSTKKVYPMTQTGHTLTGIAIGILSMPTGDASKKKVAHVVAFALLANIPDLPLDNWGHGRYDISHSIFVNLLIIGIAVLAVTFLRNVRTRIGGWPVIVGGTVAWLSHLLLDSFYNHGQGVAIFWPFSDARLSLPIRWFSVVTSLPPPITPQMMQIFLIEFASYLPLVVVAILIRRTRIVRRAATRVSNVESYPDAPA